MIEPTKLDKTKEDYYNRSCSLMIKSYNEANKEDHKFSDKTIVITYKNEKQICMDIKYTVVWAVKYWSVTLLHSSWRLYRASLIYMSELFHKKGSITDDEFVKIKALLKKTKGLNKLQVDEKRTSSKKKKSFNIKEMKEIDRSLQSSKNTWAKPLRLWIRAGRITGLRPIEWKSCKYDEETNSLIVKNAKNSNGRSLGEYRTINLKHLKSEQIKDIILHLQIAIHMSKNEKWEKYKTGCSNLLRYTSRKIWPRKEKYPTLYSGRHQFSADMKATGCTKKEVAALMGHASDLTAQEHYGKKIHGTRGKKPAVNKNDLSRVRSSEKVSFKFNVKD